MEMEEPYLRNSTLSVHRIGSQNEGPVGEIPAGPVLELVVNKGIAKIVNAHGRCLLVFLKEAGVEMLPVSFRGVGGDDSTIREIEQLVSASW
jgi:hypothetical protein